MKKKLYFIFSCILITTFFSGCWSRIEPKNLSLTNSVLFNVKDDGNIQMTKEIMKLSGKSSSQGGEGGGTPVHFNCEGKTVAEAVRDEGTGRALFGGYLSARFFSEKFAKTEMVPLLDFLSRDLLTDETPLMVVVKGDDPNQIYSSEVGLSDLAGNYMDELSRTMPKKTGESVFVTTLDFIKDDYQDGKQPVMGLVEVVKNVSKSANDTTAGSQGQNSAEKDYKLNYSGLAAFKDDKLVGYMNAAETRSYNIVTNELKSSVISLSDGLIAAKVLNSQSKLKTSIKNGQVTISVNTKFALSVIQDGANINVNEVKSLKSLEKKFNKQLETEIMTSIQKAQLEFQSDIFGFGSVVHAQHPKEWKKLKKNWDDIFSKSKVNVKVKSTIVMSGETKNPFNREE